MGAQAHNQSSNGLDQPLALSNATALQKLPEFGKLEQPSFILLIDEWDVRMHSRTKHSLITEEPFRRSEDDSGVVDVFSAIQSQGINKFIDSRSGFFKSLSLCGIRSEERRVG